MTVRNQKMHPEFAFELIIVRDDLLELLASLHSTHVGLTLSKLILDEGAPDIGLAKIAGRKRKTNLASVADRPRSALDRTWLAFDATESRPHGCANSPHLERRW